MGKLRLIIFLVLVAATAAHADTFNFTITGNIIGSGTFYTSPQQSDGSYLVTGMTGTIGYSDWFNPQTITGVFSPGFYCNFTTSDDCPPHGEHYVDALLFPDAPYFDDFGVAFTTNGDIGPTPWLFTSTGSLVVLYGQIGISEEWNRTAWITITPVVPEPSTLLLLGAGFAGMIRRKQFRS